MNIQNYGMRGYQMDAYHAILARYQDGDQRTLMILATGGGKTIVAAHVANAFLPKGRVLVLVHRSELLDQAAQKFASVTGHLPAIEKGEQWADENGFRKAQVVIASVQSMISGPAEGRKRMHRFDPMEFSFIWVDEGHHAVADSYRDILDYFTSRNPALKVLFVTATADRLDGIGMGEVCQSLAFKYDLAELIGDGYLVPIRQRTVLIDGLDYAAVRNTAGDMNTGDLETAMMLEKPLHGIAHATIEAAYDLEPGTLEQIRDREDFAEALAPLIAGRTCRRTLIFTVTVAHAKRLAEVICRWIAKAAESVDGGMDPEDRKAVIRRFANGECPILCNCMIATEGFDVPAVEMVVMARPTKSRALAVQMTGRGTRPLDDIAHVLGTLADAAARRATIALSAKPSMLVLDFAGNCGKHKLIGPADVLGGTRFDAEVVELAGEMIRDQGVDADVEDALAEAEVAVETERAVERAKAEQIADLIEEREQREFAEANRRALIRATAKYVTVDVNPFDRFEAPPVRREHGLNGNGATEPQISLLVKLGVQQATAIKYSKRQASAVISDLKAKRCTTGQAGVLRRAGYGGDEIAAMNFEHASREIETLKAAGWRREAVA